MNKIYIYARPCVNIERDYFMGRGAYGIFARAGDVGDHHDVSEIERASSERVRFLIQTTSVKIPYKPPAHEVIYLFHAY